MEELDVQRDSVGEECASHLNNKSMSYFKFYMELFFFSLVKRRLKRSVIYKSTAEFDLIFLKMRSC